MYAQLQIKVNQLYVGSIKLVVQFMQMHGIQSGHKKQYVHDICLLNKLLVHVLLHLISEFFPLLLLQAI